MQRNQSTPVKIVSRSRFRSTTEDEPSEEETPPPNRSDRPPPLPLCSSTSRIISRLVRSRTTDIAMTTADLVLPGTVLRRRRPVPGTGRFSRVRGHGGGPHRPGHHGWLVGPSSLHCCRP